jgi:hypothetical protein
MGCRGRKGPTANRNTQLHVVSLLLLQIQGSALATFMQVLQPPQSSPQMPQPHVLASKKCTSCATSLMRPSLLHTNGGHSHEEITIGSAPLLQYCRTMSNIPRNEAAAN